MHPDVDYGIKFIGMIKRRLNLLKTKADNMQKSCLSCEVTLAECMNKMSDKFTNIADLQEYLNDFDPNASFTLVGYYDSDEESFAKLLAELKGSKDDMNDDMTTCENEAGFHYVNETDGRMIIGFCFGKYTNQTISHEFTHMMQELLSSNRLFDNKVDFNENDAEDLGLSEEALQYVFDEREFYTIVLNDIYQGLQKIYWLKYQKSGMTWEDFIEKKVKTLKNDPFKVDEAEIQKDWLEYVNDDKTKMNTDFIKVFAALVPLDKEDLFDEAIKRLKG